MTDLEMEVYRKCLELALLQREEAIKNHDWESFLEIEYSIKRYKKILGY